MNMRLFHLGFAQALLMTITTALWSVAVLVLHFGTSKSPK